MSIETNPRAGCLAIAVPLLLSLVVQAGCGRSGLGFPPGPGPGDTGSSGDDVDAIDAGIDASLDPGVDDPGAADLYRAPEIETPARSAELDLLYCELDNGHLVQAALRAAACLDVSLVGVLEDASRGFVFGEMMQHGYGPATYGNCDFLRCLSNASSCAQASACDDQRWGDACDGFERRCDGTVLEACTWTGEAYRWLEVQDCDRLLGSQCQESCEGPDCQPQATCVLPEMVDDCGFYGECDGDRVRRCAPRDGESGLGAEVVIDCTELVDGGTCRELPVGGEAPGPACVHDEAECNTHFGEGFACGANGRTLDLCLFGRLTTIDCADYGYSGCEDAGFFGVRCVP